MLSFLTIIVTGRIFSVSPIGIAIINMPSSSSFTTAADHHPVSWSSYLLICFNIV
jgi:hypothetical protein